MAITPFEKDIEIIQKLDDEPNDVQGLTPEELKKRFDQAAPTSQVPNFLV